MSAEAFVAALHRINQAFDEGRPAEAAQLLAPLAASRPDDFNVLQMKARLAFAQGRLDDGVADLLAAGRQFPDRQWVWGALIEQLAAAGQAGRALALCLPVVEANPALLDVIRRMASLAVAVGDFRLVRRMAELGGETDPFLGYCLANAVLRSGDWTAGFRLYENRWAVHGARRVQPDWRGEADPSGTLLVYDEQGMGDTLQFLRYLPALRRRHRGRLILRVLEPLVPVVAGLADQVVSRQQPSSDLHFPAGTSSVYCTPLMSAPFLLDTLGEAAGVASPPYYDPPAGLVERASAVLGPRRGERPRVGLAWQGLSHSIAFTDVEPLLAVDKVDWISLQYGARDADPRLLDAMADGDLGLAAGLIRQLDMVVTCDTSIAHLAGAQGVPVWILMEKVCCWRWGDEGETTPWYASARLFRQSEQGRWAPVVERMAAELAARF